MDIHIKQQSTAFKARPGHTMLKFISKEFNGDKNKIEKFKKLFENVHQQYTNKNTIIDIDSRGNLIYSNTSFPGIKYCYKTNSSHQSSLSEKLLNECPKTIASGENTFFHQVIVKLLKKGVLISELREKADTDLLGKSFNNLLSIAERILKENPKSKLTKIEFDAMDSKMVEEKMRKFKGSFWDLIKELSN